MTVDTFAGEAQTDVVDTPDAVIDTPAETAEAVTTAADAASE